MFEEKYSGDNSKEFWDTINKVSEDGWAEVYSLGCVLQNVESQILRIINSTIEEAIEGNPELAAPPDEPKGDG